jgi:hypothetical protein
MKKHEIIIKETHRALWYEDGILVKILETPRCRIRAGRYARARIHHHKRNGRSDEDDD